MVKKKVSGIQYRYWLSYSEPFKYYYKEIKYNVLKFVLLCQKKHNLVTMRLEKY